MDLGLSGKVAAVAGASRGLGRAAALALSREGARVAICARDSVQVEEAARAISAETGGEVWARPTDVSVPEQARAFVNEAAERLGGLHVLVCNAGGPPSSPFGDITDEMWQEAFELNLLSTVVMSREAARHMASKGWGRIVNITSVSVKQPIEGLMLSNSIRAGVIGFARTLASELGPSGILVNNVCPGFTLTERLHALAETRAAAQGLSKEEVIAGYEETVPLGRLGKPAELADLITFLASERASYITGTTIQVDGGLFKGLM